MNNGRFESHIPCKHRKRKRDLKLSDSLHPDRRTFRRYQRERKLPQIRQPFFDKVYKEFINLKENRQKKESKALVVESLLLSGGRGKYSGLFK